MYLTDYQPNKPLDYVASIDTSTISIPSISVAEQDEISLQPLIQNLSLDYVLDIYKAIFNPTSTLDLSLPVVNQMYVLQSNVEIVLAIEVVVLFIYTSIDVTLPIYITPGSGSGTRDTPVSNLLQNIGQTYP